MNIWRNDMENNVIFVDLENLQYIDKNIVETNTEIIVMVGMTQSNTAINFIKEYIDNVSSIRIIKVKAQGNNALDFFIPFYLGKYLERKNNRNKHYIIISKDDGYDALIKHLKENKINIEKKEYKKSDEKKIKELPEVKNKILINSKISDKIKNVLDQIKREKGPKPSTLKGLKKRIKKIFSNSISDKEIVEIINSLRNNDNISITNKDKISYKKWE
jgi:hypothetical protein